MLEYLFGFFSKISFFLASLLGEKTSIVNIPNFVDILTSPIIDFLFERNHKLVLLFISFLILILTLRYLGRSIIEVMGGEDKARIFINKYFDSKYKIYLIGAVLTAILFSSSITIGLLVPLAVSRLIGLRKAIPFILGADLGTFTDIFLASLIVGKTSALAVSLTFFLFGVVGGVIFLPNINFLYKITKYTSKKLIQISRRKALYVLFIFLLIPLLIIIFL